MRKTLRPISIIALFSLTQWMACGDLPPNAGTINFIPASTDITFAGTGTGEAAVTVNILNDQSQPVQGLKVKIFIPLQGRLPFLNASTPVALLDEDDEPVSIEAPDGSSNEGTVQEFTTDANGNIDFVVQFPFGVDYEISVYALAVRTSAIFNISLAQAAP